MPAPEPSEQVGHNADFNLAYKNTNGIPINLLYLEEKNMLRIRMKDGQDINWLEIRGAKENLNRVLDKLIEVQNISTS